MKYLYLLFILTILCASLVYSQPPKYSRVLIHVEKSQLKAMAGLGLAMDGYFKGDGFVCELSADELLLLRKNGYQYAIMIDDVSAYYVQQNEQFKIHPGLLKAKSNTCNPSKYNTPAEFSLGSMGGFLTYNELLATLDSMHAHYPQLISQRQAFDTINTVEGRSVYWVRISNNPSVEQNKPKVLYTALTHAREPASMQQVVFYMYYLLENYNQHPDITNLINNFELYFIPCVNPDGYIYNETTDPNGGGLWRKNRRYNGGGNWGVDINRNFGYMWGFDNQGSSIDPSIDTYRGTAAFSEPESRIVKSFCISHAFTTGINYHTYSNYLLYPWGYQEYVLTPDSVTYKKYAQILTANNNYAYGGPFELLGYLSNGDCNDWMYGDQLSKPKIISFTAEAGSPVLGFWPPMNEIENICKENMSQNIYVAYLAGKFALLTDMSPIIIGSYHGFLKYNIQNTGLDSVANFVVSIVPLSGNFQTIGASKNYNNFHHLQSQNDSIAFTLNLSTVPADTVKYLLVMNNGIFTKADTIIKIFGHEAIVFKDSCNNLNNWSTSGWGLTSGDFFSAPSSITDSPNGSYQANENNSIILQSNIDLTGALYAELDFKTKFDINEGYDFVQLLISNDNGSTWQPLCGKHTINSDIATIQGQPAYEGTHKNWVSEHINLNDYLGGHVKFQFVIISNWLPFTRPDGFYFDDFTVKIIDSTLISSSMEILQPNLNVEVYPNPNNALVNITYNLSPDKKAMIKIYNSTGQLVFSKESSVTKETVDASQWSEGIYLIIIERDDGNSFYKKFVKF